MDGIHPSGKRPKNFYLEEEPKPALKRQPIIPKFIEQDHDSHPVRTLLKDRQISQISPEPPRPSRQDSNDSAYQSDLNNSSSSNLSDISDMDTDDSLVNPSFDKPPMSTSLKSRVMLQGTEEAIVKQLYMSDNGVHDDSMTAGVNSFHIINREGKPYYIFKPSSGESGTDRSGKEICSGITPGTYYLREVVPEVFNRSNFFPVPSTYIVELEGEIGSCQEFIRDAESIGRMAIRHHDMSHIDKEDLARLVLLDIIVGNLDRHLDNILVKDGRAFGIDHGLCMSSDQIDPLKIIIPDSWQYMESLSDDAIRYCQELQSEKIKSIKHDLVSLGIESEAIICCHGRIAILNKIITTAETAGIKLNISEIAHLSALFSNEAMSDNMMKKISPQIEELIKIKGEIEQIMVTGSRPKRLKLRHQSQLSKNDFAQERVAKAMSISLDDAGKVWEQLYLPTIKHMSESK